MTDRVVMQASHQEMPFKQIYLFVFTYKAFFFFSSTWRLFWYLCITFIVCQVHFTSYTTKYIINVWIRSFGKCLILISLFLLVLCSCDIYTNHNGCLNHSIKQSLIYSLQHNGLRLQHIFFLSSIFYSTHPTKMMQSVCVSYQYSIIALIHNCYGGEHNRNNDK